VQPCGSSFGEPFTSTIIARILAPSVEPIP